MGLVPPSESVEFGVEAVTEVTVPALCVMQIPLMEMQPPVRFTPLAKVDVAEFPVKLRYVPAIPAPKVEVAVLEIVVLLPTDSDEVAVRVLAVTSPPVKTPLPWTESVRYGEVVPMPTEPETLSEVSVPTEVKLDAVTPLPSVLFDRTLVELI